MPARAPSPVAQFIREKRLKSGLSQWDLARKLGYGTAQFISNWERGRSSPPLKKLKALCQILSVEAVELHELMISDALARLEGSLRRKFRASLKKARL